MMWHGDMGHGREEGLWRNPRETSPRNKKEREKPKSWGKEVAHALTQVLPGNKGKSRRDMGLDTDSEDEEVKVRVGEIQAAYGWSKVDVRHYPADEAMLKVSKKAFKRAPKKRGGPTQFHLVTGDTAIDHRPRWVHERQVNGKEAREEGKDGKKAWGSFAQFAGCYWGKVMNQMQSQLVRGVHEIETDVAVQHFLEIAKLSVQWGMVVGIAWHERVWERVADATENNLTDWDFQKIVKELTTVQVEDRRELCDLLRKEGAKAPEEGQQ